MGNSKFSLRSVLSRDYVSIAFRPRCLAYLLCAAFCLCASVMHASAWSNCSVKDDDSSKGKGCPGVFKKTETSLQEPRYEMLGPYFLDKYTGDVYYINMRWSTVQRVLLKRERVDTDIVPSSGCVNYQMIIVDDGMKNYYLVNLHSGDLWYVTRKSGARYVSVVQGDEN